MNTRNWATLGHDLIMEVVGKAVEQDRLSHSFLITGVEGVGKMLSLIHI